MKMEELALATAQQAEYEINRFMDAALHCLGKRMGDPIDGTMLTNDTGGMCRSSNVGGDTCTDVLKHFHVLSSDAWPPKVIAARLKIDAALYENRGFKVTRYQWQLPDYRVLLEVCEIDENGIIDVRVSVESNDHEGGMVPLHDVANFWEEDSQPTALHEHLAKRGGVLGAAPSKPEPEGEGD